MAEHFPRHEYFMRLALREARRAVAHDDVPIGCVIVLDDEVIAAAGNERELRNSPTAHAEMLAIEQAAKAMSSWRLLNTVIYVTLEPCLMCAGAILQARIPHLVYGAPDPKAGAAGTLYNVCVDPRLNHCVEVTDGVLADEQVELLAGILPGAPLAAPSSVSPAGGLSLILGARSSDGTERCPSWLKERDWKSRRRG